MSIYNKLTELALRRSIFFPAAELYGGHAGYYEYGPIGAALKQNIISAWREHFVRKCQALEIDGVVSLPESVFIASGHLENFVDPIVECTKCKAIYRADKLLEEHTKKQIPENLPEAEFDKLISKNKLVCPACHGMLGSVRKFNLMFCFPVGPKSEERACLRPETCQNIFIDFPRLYKTSRSNLPLTIAQVGRSFRDEISPRQGLIRQREFTQAEIEVFFNPKRTDLIQFEQCANYKLILQPIEENKSLQISVRDALAKKYIPNKLIGFYLAQLQQFYENLGLKNFRLRQLSNEEKAFYALAAWDFEVQSELGWLELTACNYRGDHDLSCHAKGSKQNLEILDIDQKVLPHVFELSIGIDRVLCVLLEQAFKEEKERIFLDLKPRLAPIFVQVCPLVSKDNLSKLAEKVYSELASCFVCEYDDSGSIGKRYRRADEIGVPFVVTIDYQTKEDNTVTIRDRNTMAQKRVSLTALKDILYKLYLGAPFSEV
ncbi:MAG: glycine--tRNA ligase, partial [Candidatus Nanoarchaeia archaeon]